MFNTRHGRDLNPGPCGWKAEILSLHQPRRPIILSDQEIFVYTGLPKNFSPCDTVCLNAMPTILSKTWD